uniref:MarR family transcriptional regulator n=1 Tax=Fervidicoccus fontis TaxID=683846 RepID=A0A7J3ZKR8_9CREN
MRWPRKREFMVYYYLFLRCGGEETTIERLTEAVRATFYYNSKTAKSIVRRLVNLGYIVRLDRSRARIRSPDEVLLELLGQYLINRSKQVRELS